MRHDAMVIYADGKSGISAETLSGVLSVSKLHTVKGIPTAIKEIAAAGAVPRHLVIDIGARAHDVLQEMDTLAEVCDATVQVVVTGETNDVGFYRELIKRGILEYFSYPVDLHALAHALTAVRQSKPASLTAGGVKEQGFAVGFYAAASGNGSSTIALNTAYALASTYQQPTVLVDLDYQFGMIARYLSIQAPYGIRELFEYPERGIDASLVNTMAAPYSKYLRVIAAPNDLRAMPAVSPQMVEDLIRALKSEFTYIVFDIPHVWSEWILTLQRQLDHNFLVSELWLRSLTHVSRLLSVWRENDIARDKLSLVMNRMGSKFKEAITLAEFERVCNLAPEFLLPNDTKTVATAENSGKTVIEQGDSEIADHYKYIAARIHGLATGITAMPAAPKKRGIAELFTKK